MSDFMQGGSLPNRACNEWADLLAMTPEELLSSSDRAAFAVHVQSCTTCAAMRKDYHLLITYARRALSVTPLPDLPASVRAEMQDVVSRPDEVLSPRFEVLQPSTNNHQRLLPHALSSRLARTRTRLDTRHSFYPRLLWLAAACLIVLFLICFNWLPVFQASTHQAQAATLSLQSSLTDPKMMPPPGATFLHTVSWSPNGEYIAVLWDDSIIQVRDAQRNYAVIFTQKVGWGYGLAWSPDSQLLASIGGQDNTIQIWNISTLQCAVNAFHQCMTYTGHTAQVEAIAWSPNGDYIASASDDQTVQVWDAHTMKLLYRYQDPGSEVKAIAWSPDGKRLVLGDDNNHVQAWDALTGAHLISYRGHTGTITFVGWSPDGKFILSSSYDNTVQIWDAKTADVVSMFHLPGPIFAASCLWEKTPGNDAYLALVVVGSIQIWHLSYQQGKVVPQWLTTSSIANQGQSDNIDSISWSPYGDRIVAGGGGDILYFRLR